MRRAALAVVVVAAALAGVAWLTTRPVTERESAPREALASTGAAPARVPSSAPVPVPQCLRSLGGAFQITRR